MTSTLDGEKPGLDASSTFDIYDMLSEGSEGAPTSQDAQDMHRLGNKQEFKRNFHSLSVLGLTCVLISTWMAVLGTAEFSLINGGRAGTIWMYVGSWICTLAVVASLAEMASMAPTAGGQYHWVSEFAPRSLQKPLSYVSGWLAALGWQTFVGGSAYQTATTILIMVSFGMPSYQSTAWQETILTIVIGVIALLFNVFGAKRLPLFEGVILCCYILGFFAVVIPLWVLAPKASAKEVFTSFENYGGWSSMGVACIVGQSAAAEALIGVDSAVHMSEEVKKASKTVPRMMLWTIVLNGILGFVMILTFTFVVQDIQRQFLDTDLGYPFVGVFYDATGSVAAAIGMTVPIVIMTFSMCINSIMAASRQSWAFARDNGVPFANWFTKIATVDSTPLPINSMIFSLAILIIIALLNLGGSEIVNSIVSLLGGAIGTTYCISIGCVLWRRLFSSEPLPPASWSLGRWGPAINIFALAYQAWSTIMSFFPVFAKVTAKEMNWSIAIFGGVVVLSMVYYLISGRKKYQGPVVRIVKDD